jgi:membrane associated rhomboid family serine protease
MSNPAAPPETGFRAPPLPALPAALWAVILACLIPEVVLFGADHGVWGSPRWRQLAYQYGAFWAGLLHGWRPNYAAQPALMFLTYGFLHAGLGHLAGNLAALAVLGRRAVTRVGRAGFAAIFTTALLAGAGAFGLISRSPAPMVGVSGAIFGLAGGWIVWEWQDRRHARLWPTLGLALGLTLALAVFNLAVWWLLHGSLAWETHLGGFLAGAALAAVLERRR